MLLTQSRLPLHSIVLFLLNLSVQATLGLHKTGWFWKRVVLVDAPWTPKSGTRVQKKKERRHQKPEINQKGRKGAGVKGAGVANCRIFRSAVPSVVVWSILLVSLSGVKKKL